METTTTRTPDRKARADVLVDPDWLERHLGDPNVRVVEVDVSAAAYDDWHVDGAVLWNIYRDLKDADYRLLSDTAFASLMGRSGIDADSTTGPPAMTARTDFFHEDFVELRDCGYLQLALPPEFGGAGLRLSEILRLQERIAYVAPATALAVNMHFYWTGLAADLWRAGDKSCEFVLAEAAAGKIFAAGHGEAGNDIPLLLSTADARRTADGWTISGHKIFGSLSPVWDYLGFHAMDTTSSDAPLVVHGFLARDDRNYRIESTWDALGMRATDSNDTIIDGTFIPDERVALVCPAGFAGAGPFQVGIFAWALLGFSAVYVGLARRAFDLTVENLPKRTSIALTRPMSYHPEVQHYVAEMRMKLEAIQAYLDRTASDWSEGVEHPDWPVKLVSTKYVVTNQAFEIVDGALDLSGGAGIFKRNRLEQLFRDARLGRIHPANTLLAHELVGKLSLGIDPDEAPRWG